MSNKITMTYKGMFGLCPIYLDDSFEYIEPRHKFLMPLLWLSDVIFFNIYQPYHFNKYGEESAFVYSYVKKLPKPFVSEYWNS